MSTYRMAIFPMNQTYKIDTILDKQQIFTRILRFFVP